MHINWGFWGALLGVSTLAHMSEQRQRNGDELAKTLMLCMGRGEDDEARRILSGYRFGGTMNQALNSAYDAAMQMQQLQDGQISSAPHVLQFRDWCRTLV